MWYIPLFSVFIHLKYTYSEITAKHHCVFFALYIWSKFKWNVFLICVVTPTPCFILLGHRQHPESSGGPAETRAGSEGSSSGPCLSCAFSSPVMAGLCGPRWPTAYPRNHLHGVSLFDVNLNSPSSGLFVSVTILLLFVVCITMLLLAAPAGAVHRATVSFLPPPWSPECVLLCRQPDPPHCWL